MKIILPNFLFFFENQYSHRNHFSGITASLFPITANGQTAALVTVLAISAMMLLKQNPVDVSRPAAVATAVAVMSAVSGTPAMPRETAKARSLFVWSVWTFPLLASVLG
ncbi:hypothetical protein [Paenibacillus luteus]|uniref:hypothetical protein n=1 Tax=Paenibacillus luteus TaxID=2545753 RepID=UPI0011419868|nr:hypothetical protein [Paenibacillus luteus]